MKFSYAGYDSQGRASHGMVEAADDRDAREQLRRKGIYATSVQAGEVRSPGREVAARRGRARLTDVAAFMRELAVLVGSGTPLVDALGSIERQTTPGRWRDVVADLRTRVEEGESLSEAMARHPENFDAIARSLVTAGEQGAKLEPLLDRLARLMRQQVRTRKMLLGAMIYPCLLITIACVVLAAMVGFVMPRFEGLFKSLQAPLPPSTRVLMDIGAFLRSNWWMVLGGVAAGVVSLMAYLKSSGGQRARDHALVRLPQIGRAVRSLATARVARVLGVLLDGRVPLLDALKLLRGATGNAAYAELVERAEQAVTRGEGLAAALSGGNLIPPSVCEAIRNGEKSGRLGAVLTSVADYMDEDNEVVLKTATNLIEPIILMVMGLLVGAVAISMFLPLFDLTSASGTGGGG